MLTSILVYGALIGLLHFVIVGVLYGNPVVDARYQQAMREHAGVRRWDSRPRYLVTQFLGTQLEVYALTAAFFILRPLFASLADLVGLAALLAAVRVYPRFWNMWIQSTYPRNLLAIEFVNGTLSTFAVILGLGLLV
jgi:hypothetical protein